MSEQEHEIFSLADIRLLCLSENIDAFLHAKNYTFETNRAKNRFLQRADSWFTDGNGLYSLQKWFSVPFQAPINLRVCVGSAKLIVFFSKNTIGCDFLLHYLFSYQVQHIGRAIHFLLNRISLQKTECTHCFWFSLYQIPFPLKIRNHYVLRRMCDTHLLDCVQGKQFEPPTDNSWIEYRLLYKRIMCLTQF